MNLHVVSFFFCFLFYFWILGLWGWNGQSEGRVGVSFGSTFAEKWRISLLYVDSGAGRLFSEKGLVFAELKIYQEQTWGFCFTGSKSV